MLIFMNHRHKQVIYLMAFASELLESSMLYTLYTEDAYRNCPPSSKTHRGPLGTRTEGNYQRWRARKWECPPHVPLGCPFMFHHESGQSGGTYCSQKKIRHIVCRHDEINNHKYITHSCWFWPFSQNHEGTSPLLFCDIIQLCPFSAQKSNEPSENSCEAELIWIV